LPIQYFGNFHLLSSKFNAAGRILLACGRRGRDAALTSSEPSGTMGKRDSLGNFELMVLLALIRLGEPSYGVPISEEIANRSGREVAFGSVYAALERLEKKKYVTSSLGDPKPERGGRAKRYFRVTPKGLREVREAQRVFISLWQGVPDLQAGMA
jgi:PadR family transcriptional regulator